MQLDGYAVGLCFSFGLAAIPVLDTSLRSKPQGEEQVIHILNLICRKI